VGRVRGLVEQLVGSCRIDSDEGTGAHKIDDEVLIDSDVGTEAG